MKNRAIAQAKTKNVQKLLIKAIIGFSISMITLITLIIFAKEAKANEIFATAEIVKGEVSVLLPGQKEATLLKQGDVLPEDTSILTNDKSFVRIILNDKSSITLSSNSKIVLKETKKDSKPNVVSILKGQIRANVTKDYDSDKVKLMIRTNSASMGVRGTDFIIAYDSENDAASLVTFEGKVAIVPKILSEEESLKKLNESNLLIEAGEFSGVNQKKTTEKVKISEAQLEALKNDVTEEKEKKKIKLGKDELVVDLKTGQAVQGYTGFVDLATGEYTPVEGLELKDSGFVPKNKESLGLIKTALVFNKDIKGEKYWERKVTFLSELYSQRNDFELNGGEVAVKNDWQLRPVIRLEIGDLENRYYSKFSTYKSKFESLGSTNGTSGRIENDSMSALDLGYERVVSDKMNVFGEVGFEDDLKLNGSTIEKTTELKGSIGIKHKIMNKEKFYPYFRAQVNVNSGKNPVSAEAGLGLSKDFYKAGLFGDIWINRGSHKQKGGILLGVSFLEF